MALAYVASLSAAPSAVSTAERHAFQPLYLLTFVPEGSADHIQLPCDGVDVLIAIIELIIGGGGRAQ